MKRMLVIVGALAALLAPAGAALASPVNLFSFQLKNLKPDGRFTLLFTARTFDTTGGVPPTITTNYLRLPAGAVLRRQFLDKRYFCNGPLLRDSLNAHPPENGEPFADRVLNLKPFIKLLSRSHSRRDRRALANAIACQRGKIGTGTAKIDARATFPTLTDLIPSKFALFFSRPTAKGAIAGFTSVGAADARSPVVKKEPVVAGVHVALSSNFFNDPTPDGRYGYKLVLPTGNVNGFAVSIAELHVTTTGLSLLKGTCLKTSRRGRCTRREHRTLFWFTRPTCPASGQISFLDVFQYASLPTVTKTIQLPCPKFG